MARIRTLTAKFSGRCEYSNLSGCKGIKAGDRIVSEGRGHNWHQGCGPTGVDSRADAEYMRGMVEAQEERFIRNTFGEEAAAQYEYERYMRFGDEY